MRIPLGSRSAVVDDGLLSFGSSYAFALGGEEFLSMVDSTKRVDLERPSTVHSRRKEGNSIIVPGLGPETYV